MTHQFEGTIFQRADNWYNMINPILFSDKPINYLEIGVHSGANAISVAESYCKHNESKIYCVDPWITYDEYPEYKNEIDDIYGSFLRNIYNYTDKHKFKIRRGFSNEQVPKFDDNYFDIIYIDGNHEPEYVLEDAVLSFRKLKINGYLIFDDYGWGGLDLTKKGIDAFANGYHKRINILGLRNTQVFIQKIK